MRQNCFFSPLNPQNSSSRQRTMNWKRSVHETRVELYKQSYRPDQDCVYYFNLRRAQDAPYILHLNSSDGIPLYDNMPTNALDKMITFAKWLFRMETPTLTMPEATPCDKIWLVHVIRNRKLWTRKNQKKFSFPIQWHKSWNLQTNRQWSAIRSTIIHWRMKKKSEIQKIMLYSTLTWNEMKL